MKGRSCRGHTPASRQGVYLCSGPAAWHTPCRCGTRRGIARTTGGTVGCHACDRRRRRGDVPLGHGDRPTQATSTQHSSDGAGPTPRGRSVQQSSSTASAICGTGKLQTLWQSWVQVARRYHQHAAVSVVALICRTHLGLGSPSNNATSPARHVHGNQNVVVGPEL